MKNINNFSVDISNEAVKQFSINEFGVVPKTQAEFLNAKCAKVRKEFGEWLNERENQNHI